MLLPILKNVSIMKYVSMLLWYYNMKRSYTMEESFLDVITDSALHERFDKIILQDEKYIKLHTGKD